MALDRSTVQAVEQAVKQAEKRCKAEFVCVWAKRSSSHLGLKLTVALLAGFLVALGELFALYSGWGAGDWLTIRVVMLPVLVFGVMFLLMQWPWAFRVLLPDALFSSVVRQAAEAEFFKKRVFATQARTGVLIYVSDFEHEVMVLADEGLAAHTSAEEWSELGFKLAESLASQGSLATFETALSRISKKLEERMGPRVSKENELPDHLRT